MVMVMTEIEGRGKEMLTCFCSVRGITVRHFST